MKFLSSLFRGLGVMLFFYTLYLILSNILVVYYSHHITGTVVYSYSEYISRSHTNRSSRYQNSGGSGTHRVVKRPVIVYTIDGKERQVHGELLGSIGLQYELGQEIGLWVLKDNPDYAIVDSFLEMWLMNVIYLALSVFLFFANTIYRRMKSLFVLPNQERPDNGVHTVRISRWM
jgi:hypothetical protein